MHQGKEVFPKCLCLCHFAFLVSSAKIEVMTEYLSWVLQPINSEA